MTQKKKRKNKIKQAPDEFRGLYWSFNLPNGKIVFGDSVYCKGNGMSLGLTNGTTNGGLMGYTFSQVDHLGSNPNSYGKPVSTSAYMGTAVKGQTGITLDPTKSGIVVDLSSSINAIIKY